MENVNKKVQGLIRKPWTFLKTKKTVYFKTSSFFVEERPPAFSLQK
jgi:hypothetical protein